MTTSKFRMLSVLVVAPCLGLAGQSQEKRDISRAVEEALKAAQPITIAATGAESQADRPQAERRGLPGDAEVRSTLQDAARLFRQLESSPEFEAGRRQAEQQLKGLEASPDFERQKLRFQQQLRELLASPQLLQQKRRLELDLKSLEVKESRQ